jgi:hypothetical protein
VSLAIAMLSQDAQAQPTSTSRLYPIRSAHTMPPVPFTSAQWASCPAPKLANSKLEIKTQTAHGPWVPPPAAWPSAPLPCGTGAYETYPPPPQLPPLPRLDGPAAPAPKPAKSKKIIEILFSYTIITTGASEHFKYGTLCTQGISSVHMVGTRVLRTSFRSQPYFPQPVPSTMFSSTSFPSTMFASSTFPSAYFPQPASLNLISLNCVLLPSPSLNTTHTTSESLRSI